jgi:hypothetical protein
MFGETAFGGTSYTSPTKKRRPTNHAVRHKKKEEDRNESNEILFGQVGSVSPARRKSASGLKTFQLGPETFGPVPRTYAKFG